MRSILLSSSCVAVVTLAVSCGGAHETVSMPEPWVTRPKDKLLADAGVAGGEKDGGVLDTEAAVPVTRRVDFGVPVSDLRKVGERFVALIDSGNVANIGDVVLGTPREGRADELSVQRLLRGARLDAGLGASCGLNGCDNVVLTWLKKYGSDDQVHVTEVTVGGKLVSDQRLTKTSGWKSDPCVAQTGRGYLAAWVEAVSGNSTVSVVALDSRLRKMVDTRRLNEFGSASDLRCERTAEGVLVGWDGRSEDAASGVSRAGTQRRVELLDSKGNEINRKAHQQAPSALHCFTTAEGEWCPEAKGTHSSAIWAFRAWPKAD